jgi:hypothetical protein
MFPGPLDPAMLVCGDGNGTPISSPPAKEKPKQPKKLEDPALPRLNRAQRRALRRYITHKARAQMRRVLRDNIQARMAYLTRTQKRCDRCNLLFLGSTMLRCQCKVELRGHRRQCRMCGAEFMASYEEWQRTNICAECVAYLEVQRENEVASRSAVYNAYYERRAWDDEQHRIAMEAQ